MRGLFRRVWKAVLTLGALFAVIATMPTQSALAQVEEMAPRAGRYSPDVIEGELDRIASERDKLGLMIDRASRQACVSREGLEALERARGTLYVDRDRLREPLWSVFGFSSGASRRFTRLGNDLMVLGNRIGGLRACPEPVRILGLYLGVDTVKTWGRLNVKEFDAFSGQQANNIVVIKDPFGGGVVAGYNFALANGLIVGPYLSFDALNMSIRRTFPAGTFIGSTTHWFASAGAKVGMTTSSGLFIYGLGGASLLNQELNINFGGPFTSDTKNTPGGTLGVGAEFVPSMLQGFGVPISVFAQYQHTWWADARLDRPAASPFFNYRFGREDNTIKFGLNFYLGATPPPSPRPALITK